MYSQPSSQHTSSDSDMDDHQQQHHIVDIDNDQQQFYVDKINIDQYLDEMEDEDGQVVDQKQQQQQTELDKGRKVRQQLQKYKVAIKMLMQIQKQKEQTNRMPLHTTIHYFTRNQQILEQQQTIQLGIIKQIQDIMKIQDIHIDGQQQLHQYNLLKGAELGRQIDYANIWDAIQKRQQQMYDWEKEIVSGWSQKTAIVSQIKKGMGNLMHTPHAQAEKILNNVGLMLSKSNIKDGDYRILGEELLDLETRANLELYSDGVFYQEVMKEYLEKEEEGVVESGLRSIRLRRARKNEKNGAVDRKASKNRKIRYNVHDKLINFMTSCSQQQMQDRDAFIDKVVDRSFKEHDDKKLKKLKKDSQDEIQLV